MKKMIAKWLAKRETRWKTTPRLGYNPLPNNPPSLPEPPAMPPIPLVPLKVKDIGKDKK